MRAAMLLVILSVPLQFGCRWRGNQRFCCEMLSGMQSACSYADGGSECPSPILMQVARFLPNPEAFWGPKPKAGRPQKVSSMSYGCLTVPACDWTSPTVSSILQAPFGVMQSYNAAELFLGPCMLKAHHKLNCEPSLTPLLKAHSVTAHQSNRRQVAMKMVTMMARFGSHAFSWSTS